MFIYCCKKKCTLWNNMFNNTFNGNKAYLLFCIQEGKCTLLCSSIALYRSNLKTQVVTKSYPQTLQINYHHVIHHLCNHPISQLQCTLYFNFHQSNLFYCSLTFKFDLRVYLSFQQCINLFVVNFNLFIYFSILTNRICGEFVLCAEKWGQKNSVLLVKYEVKTKVITTIK